MSQKAALRSLIIAALLGVPIALIAMGLMELIHLVEHEVWYGFPEHQAGWESGPPWWYVIGVTTVAATAAALTLAVVKKDVTHEVSMTPPPLRHLPLLLVGAILTLGGGLVLGPEAPLLALGIALMGVAAHRTSSSFAENERAPYTTILALAGAMIVLGMVLGSAIVAIVLMLEILANSGKVESKQIVPVLIPGMLAAGVGALVFTGVGNWTGVTPPTLSIPDLPAYPTVQWVDLAWAPVVGLVASLVVVITRKANESLIPFALAHPRPLTAAVGLITGGLAVGYRALTDQPIGDILFSGQTALPDIVGIDTAWILLALIVAKGIAYSLALVGRLEGGQIFPAMAMSGAVGTIAAIVLPGTSLTAMLAIAIAAGTTSLQRLPIFGVVFAMLLVAGNHVFDLAPLAILGGVIGFVVSGAIATRTAAAAAAAEA